MSTQHPRRWTLLATVIVAAGITVSSGYGLLAESPYRGISAATELAARAQDVCSLLVAGLLLLQLRSGELSPRAHLVRLGLLAYVLYSYAIYLDGVPMNRTFLVYVVLESVAGAAFLDGLVRLLPSAWPRVASRRLERGTGWMLVTVAALFALLWLTALLPYAAGGDRPTPEGPGGVAYPVFVLDLVVVLPCIAAVGLMLLRGRPIAGPLAVVALVKIVTLFTALWAGVVADLVVRGHVALGPDAVPSLVMLALSVWLLVLWLPGLQPTTPFLRSALWVGEQAGPSSPPSVPEGRTRLEAHERGWKESGTRRSR